MYSQGVTTVKECDRSLNYLTWKNQREVGLLVLKAGSFDDQENLVDSCLTFKSKPMIEALLLLC